MNKLIKSNIYRIFSNHANVFWLFISPIAAYIIAILKVKYYDGYTDYIECFRFSFEYHIVPASIIIPLLTYSFMFEYFEGRLNDVETIMRYKFNAVVFSKLFSVTAIIGFVFCIVDLLFLGINYTFYGECIYSNNLVRVLEVFLIYAKICFDSVLIFYIFNNFFVYIGGIFAIWFFIVKKMKFMMLGFYAYSLTYKYQMSIIASFGGSNELLIRKVMPYLFISLIIKTILLYGIVAIRHKEDG
ncbi:MAG: hypothetical protein J5517_04195 [Eubacterium sp.]|nr:hypothetical protein [Eubacterium sp.]